MINTKDCRNCRYRYCYYNLKVPNKLINTFVNLWQSFQTLQSPTITDNKTHQAHGTVHAKATHPRALRAL